MGAAAPAAARTRVRVVFWALVVVNAVMLWFFVGTGASLSWHSRMLDDETLADCAHGALAQQDLAATWGDYRDARFVGDATVAFEVSLQRYDKGDDGGHGERPVALECTLGVPDDAGSSDDLVVERARVVER